MSANRIEVVGGNSGITSNELINIDPIKMGSIDVNVSSIRVVDAADYVAKKVVKDGSK
ncbi:MAG: hypothetical protein JHC33_04040 [Ignisphaera sp.]|nr:hypothetical protein [Ignisphaera sp.]